MLIFSNQTYQPVRLAHNVMDLKAKRHYAAILFTKAHHLRVRQGLLVMKLTIILLLATCLHVAAIGSAQKVTLSETNVSLQKVFKEINRQTGLKFFYQVKQLSSAEKISINVKNAPVEEVLKICFKNQNIGYTISQGTIVVTALTNKTATTQQAAIPPIEVKGIVTDDSGTPLTGASVTIKGTQQGVTTDAEGKFTIQVYNGDAVLIVSYVGSISQEIKLNGQKELTVIMVRNIATQQDVVVIGYGTQKRKEISGAVASVKINEISADASNNVTSALQGRIPGVSFESNSGAPGAGLSVTIRGSSTLGNNNPLVVIDGIPFGSLDGLSPSDIQSIDILKDASAANIYGSRAAGGVIIVTTKTGRKNTQPRININTVYSSSSIPKRMKVLSGKELVDLFNNNGGNMPANTGINTNWQDEIFTSAPTYKANMDITGGTQHLVYSLSGAYLKQQGTIINSHHEMANFRVRSVYEKGRVKIGQTFIYNATRGRSHVETGDQTHSSVINAIINSPNIPARDATNTAGGGWGKRPAELKNLSNIVALMNVNNNRISNNSVVLDAFAEVRLIDQLKYKLNIGYSNDRGLVNNYTEKYDDGTTNISNPMSAMSASYASQWLVENILSYEKTVGAHNFSLMAGYSAQKDTANGFGVSARMPASNLYGMGAATTFDKPTGASFSTARTSQFGRVTYSYDNRYSINASVRQDASSIFHTSNNKGTFYGASAAWTVSNESFFKTATNAINQLKIRAGVGTLGNDRIAPYSTLGLIATNLSIITGNNSLLIGNIPSGAQSPKGLSWEQSSTVNVGVDAAFLNSKLTLVFDWFKKQSKGVLLPVPIPLSTGIGGAPIVNAGDIQNQGIELSLNYGDKVNDWYYNVGWNMAAIKNKMVDVTIGSGNQEFGDIQRGKVGYPLGGFFLIKNAGTFKSQQEMDNYKHNGQKIQPNAQPGDLRFIDYNNDGIIDNNDQQYVGSPMPNFETGLTANLRYKNFDFNLLLQGTFGNKIYNYTRYWSEKMNEYHNYSTSVLGAWSPNNSSSNFPRFILTDPNQSARQNSDRWLEDGSYVRVRRVEMGYTVPQEIVKNKLNLENVRAYISSENPFTVTKYTGYNPDLGRGGDPLNRGRDAGVYPLTRTLSVGLSVSF